jgi:hypothetical protein
MIVFPRLYQYSSHEPSGCSPSTVKAKVRGGFADRKVNLSGLNYGDYTHSELFQAQQQFKFYQRDESACLLLICLYFPLVDGVTP